MKKTFLVIALITAMFLTSCETKPDLYEPNFDVDVVYTWVNNRDEDWLKCLNHYRVMLRMKVVCMVLIGGRSSIGSFMSRM